MAKNARADAIARWQWPDKIAQYAQLYDAVLNPGHYCKVSIIVTCHNLANFLPAALDSVKAQVYTDWECLIVDDASTDNTRDVAIEYAVFLPRQFENPANVEAHYEQTAPEIEHQLASFGLEADAFVAGVGTGGTVMGVGRYLRRAGRPVTVHPLEPANSPTMRTGCKVGAHRIQGISDEFIPSIIDLASLDEIVDVWDGDSILMAQELCSRLGLSVGISSGANFLGAAKIVERMGGDAVIATLFPDSNKKYLATDLCRKEPCGEDYWTPRIELQGFRAVRIC